MYNIRILKNLKLAVQRKHFEMKNIDHIFSSENSIHISVLRTARVITQKIIC